MNIPIHNVDSIAGEVEAMQKRIASRADNCTKMARADCRSRTGSPPNARSSGGRRCMSGSATARTS